MVLAAHQRVYDTFEKFGEHSESLSWGSDIFLSELIHSFPLQIKTDMNRSDHSSSSWT